MVINSKSFSGILASAVTLLVTYIFNKILDVFVDRLQPLINAINGWYFLAPGIVLMAASIVAFIFFAEVYKKAKKFGIITGICGLILIALSSAFFMRQSALWSCEWTPKTLEKEDETKISVPKQCNKLVFEISGVIEGGGFSVEFEKLNSNKIEKLDVTGLEEDTSIIASKYYRVRIGTFYIEDNFYKGDLIRVNTINSVGFNGRLSLELIKLQ